MIKFKVGLLIFFAMLLPCISHAALCDAVIKIGTNCYDQEQLAGGISYACPCQPTCPNPCLDTPKFSLDSSAGVIKDNYAGQLYANATARPDSGHINGLGYAGSIGIWYYFLESWCNYCPTPTSKAMPSWSRAVRLYEKEQAKYFWQIPSDPYCLGVETDSYRNRVWNPSLTRCLACQSNGGAVYEVGYWKSISLDPSVCGDQQLVADQVFQAPNASAWLEALIRNYTATGSTAVSAESNQIAPTGTITLNDNRTLTNSSTAINFIMPTLVSCPTNLAIDWLDERCEAPIACDPNYSLVATLGVCQLNPGSAGQRCRGVIQ